MKKLISSNIINKFKNCISEEEYEKSWKKFQEYQKQKKEIKKYRESEFQSGFLSIIFGEVLGYVPRTKSLDEANLIVEKKIEEGKKFIDGAIIGKDNKTRIVIELKNMKTKDLFKSQSGRGLHSLPPIQQAAIYLFSEPLADLAVVSNFDKVIIFDRKEKFRQEFSLFNMNYEKFKEFYLILSANNYWNGLTQMMIKQTTEQDKEIDNDFYLKIKALYRILKNTMKEEYAKDLFNKFLALAILEDNGNLPANLINSIHNKKNDLLYKGGTHWKIWSDFFKSLKKLKPGKDLMGIDPAIAKLDVWQDTSYLGRVKVEKSTLDLVVEISKYDLFSIPLQKLFYNIALQIESTFETIDFDNFDYYSELLNANDYTGCDQTLSFIILKTYDENMPLIKLFNQISKNEKIIVKKDEIKVAFSPDLELDDYWLIIRKTELDNRKLVTLIKKRASELKIQNDCVLIHLINDDNMKNLPLRIEVNNKKNNRKFEMNRKDIKRRIIILSEEEQKWLDENLPDSKPLNYYAKLTNENNADVKFNLYTKIATKKEPKINMWEPSNDFVFNENNILYFKVNQDKISISDFVNILESPDFSKVMKLISWDKKSFMNLPVFSKLTSKKWLSKAKEYRKIKEMIRLYNFKLDEQQEKNSPELEILKTKEILKNLYEKKENFEW